MRNLIVAGNWKMNNTLSESKKLVSEIIKKFQEYNSDGSLNNVKVILAPPFPMLPIVSEQIEGTSLLLSAQNCSNKAKGAYTGEVSVDMLISCGCQSVIIGHSERRQYYGETDEILKEKVDLSIHSSLDVIFCVGETQDERQADQHFEVIQRQLEKALFHLSDSEFAKVIVAYEPVWAIGTGLTATPEQAQEIHHFIRGLVEKKYGVEMANNLHILYGGSCKPSNSKDLFALEDVDGGLIGGAALDADQFVDIIRTQNR